ncbi:mechanosensitive ion channel [Shewanella schlegeliana]|uniref:Mechanosensitive ion channel n=1 Tax=Shewanella schlegeliana TaxID=190308 RepID=A0ABS1SWB5_9GAMM|nr:mechanosensitive ion channel domain-containing protein [Shewanella schlegeliana]MBL4912625.1 mechanosensitive ion channel [Shewanella schlegeliana]MCL1109867.1 mechanosensitive ion channel [Shewanella schlegeliana]
MSRKTELNNKGRLWWLCLFFGVMLFSLSSSAQTLPDAAFFKSEITRLNSESPKNEALISQYETLLSRVNGYKKQKTSRDEYRNIISQFPMQRERLLKKINDVEQLDIFNVLHKTKYNDLSQSIATLQAAVTEWRSTYQSNSDKNKQLINARTALPQSLAQIDREIEKASIVKSDTDAQLEQWLESTNLTMLKLQRQVTSAQLQSLDERTELLGLEQQLLNKKIQTASPILIELQDKLTRVEQASVKTLIEQARKVSEDSVQEGAENQQLIEQLKAYTVELEQVLAEIDQARISYQKVEAEQRSLMDEQRLIKNNLTWLRNSTAFGASIRAQLQRLPAKVNTQYIPDIIAKAHIRKYEIGQETNKFALQATAAGDTAKKKAPDKVTRLLSELLVQLAKDYEKLISALSQLKLAKDQYAQAVDKARTFLKQQQLWTRSNVPLWQHLTDFNAEVWFGSKTPFKEILDKSTPGQSVSFLMLFALYTSLLVYIMIRLNRYAARRKDELQKVFGHPLKDRFHFTVSLFSLAILCALILPIWYAITTWGIYWFWPVPTSNEITTLIFASASALFVVELIHALSYKQGVLLLHLNWPDHICSYLHKGSHQVRWPFVILLLSIFMAELISGTNEAEISRVLFLLLMAAMMTVFISLLKKNNLPSTLPSPLNQGVSLYLLRLVIIGSFIVIVIMAVMGLYIASWVLLIYQQLTLYLVLAVLLTYQMGERWLKLEHRQLSYQRLLAHREELIAQQQEQADELPEITELRETIPDVEERSLASEQISEQSLTLLRGLSLIGLVVAVLTLWSSALEMTSWLNNIVVWQVNEVTETGVSLMDVTLQSLLYAIVTLIVTLVGVRNLPGILELLILRRLDLAPGAGYAVTTLLRYMILMAGLMGVFSILGFQWSKLQWLVAAFGVGLGFGLQEIFANFISGLILLFERPIRIGDIVTINDLSGTVSKIQTRATTIIDWDNKEIVVPNKTFITEKLINWSLTSPMTRIVIPIGVAYGSDIDQVETLLYQIADEHPLVLPDPQPSVVFLSFGASSLDFELRVHITAIELRLSTVHIINKNIDRLFREHNIEIAFPQMDVHVRDWPPKPNDV